MHPSSGMLPSTKWEKMLIPGARHLELLGIVPIRASKAAWMVGHLTDGDGGVTVLTKPGGHAGGNGLRIGFQSGRSLKEGVVASASILTGEERKSGSPTGGGLNVVVPKDPSFCGETVNVGRMNVVDPIALEFRSQIVDANEEDIRSGRLGDHKGRNEDGQRLETLKERAFHEMGFLFEEAVRWSFSV